MPSSPLMDEQCCPSWLRAQSGGTDNEGYGALLHDYANPRRFGRVEEPRKPSTWFMGCDMPQVQFCPWCGAKKT